MFKTRPIVRLGLVLQSQGVPVLGKEAIRLNNSTYRSLGDFAEGNAFARFISFLILLVDEHLLLGG